MRRFQGSGTPRSDSVGVVEHHHHGRDEHGGNGDADHLEPLLVTRGRADETAGSRRILELNGEHPVVEAMRELYEKNAEDQRVEDYGRLLYEQAVIAEGSKVKDPTAFARRINELLVKDAKS